MNVIHCTAVFQGSVKKQILLCCTAALFLASCLGPQKIDKWVARQYHEVPVPVKKKTDQITVLSNFPAMDKISTTEKRTSNLIPLVVYWQWDYINTCTLNPQIAVNNFTTTVATYANRGLKQKLNGQRVEFTIEKLPNTFEVDYKGHIVWVIYFFHWEKLSVQPQKTDMVVSYKVFKSDNSVAKTGTITVADTDKGFGLGMFQSLRRKTMDYLSDYDGCIASMSKTVVDKLAAEL